MRPSLTVFIFFICSNTFGQTNNYQNLLETAVGLHGALFVYFKPIKNIRLNPKEMWKYAENIKEKSNQNLDTAMFFQVIYNSKLADTTLWTDKEVPKALLINQRGATISKKYALQKFGSTYDKQINEFNSLETIDRNLSDFSRPVFDNSKKFAILQWDNGHGYFGGGGGIVLYQLQNDHTWKELGTIDTWKY